MVSEMVQIKKYWKSLVNLNKIYHEHVNTLFGLKYCLLQYRSALLSINPAFRAGACTDCEDIECTIAIIIIVILVRSLFLVDIMCSFG